MPVIPLGYPLDLTATAATNFIQNEVVTFNTVQEKMFVPSKGPFYTLSMEIRHGVTNALLQPETQYKLLQPVKEAIRMSGKEVCAVIYITDNSIPSITISYRVIGGVFSDTASEIGDILLNNPLSLSGQVSWWDILDKPDQFTPSEHLHHVDNIYGMSDVVAVLENMRIAILAGDSVAISAIYQYINNLLSNLAFATENYVDDTFAQLGSTPYVRTFKTYNDLRAFSDLVNNESYIYLATGKNAVNDRLGNIFMWDASSTETDDGRFVLKPDHVLVTNPGRYVSPLRDTHEQKKLATSVQRVLNTTTEEYEDSLLINQAVVVGDCNNYIKEGKFWIGTGIANSPFPNCVMEVTNITALNADPSQGEVLQVFDDGLGKRARRIRQYVSPGVYQWSDLIIKDDAGVEEKIECNIGIVVKYFGQDSLIMPCFIGEEENNAFNPTTVTVFISGAIKTISLYDIEPAYQPGYIGDSLKTVYLEENPAGVFRLVIDTSSAVPDYTPQETLDFNRSPLFYPGTDPGTSNKLFVGLALMENYKFVATRCWFNDIGFVEYYHDFNIRPSQHTQPQNITTRFTGKNKKFTVKDNLSFLFSNMEDSAPVYKDDLDNNIITNVPSLPVIAWKNEEIRVDVNLTLGFEGTGVTKNKVTVWSDDDFFQVTPVGSPYLDFISVFKTTAVNNVLTNNDFISVHGSASVKKPEDTGLRLQLLVFANGNDSTPILPGSGSQGYAVTQALNVILTNARVFRNPIISTIDPAFWFSNLRVVPLNGNLFDIDLKAYHDNHYGSPAPANYEVVFIVNDNCLVSASTTSNYAITNPDTWASGVITKLRVLAGGFVVGRGGDGGRGGKAFRQATDTDGDGWTDYYGGDASNPSSVVHGKKGGNAIRTMRALVVENDGFISVGSGGGGATAGGIIYFNTAGVVSKICLSGNAGGGGWPYGQAGLPGQIIFDDSTQSEYYLDTLDGYQAWHVSGNQGENSGGLEKLTTLSSGGDPITRTNGSATISHNQAGAGGLVFIDQTSTGGGGTNWDNVVSANIGDAGNGGDEGTYAINTAGGGSVTIIPSGGTIKGTVGP